MKNFSELGFTPEICEALKHQGIKTATPVQEQAIPAVRAGGDVIVQAQTGTGKTLTFLLPLMTKIKAVPVLQGMVIVPTRELAIQIGKVAAKLTEATGIKSVVIYGGKDIERQKERLAHHPQLVIGTPGRLLDHVRRRSINLSQINKVVLDEADEMLKLGFIEDVEQLLALTAKDNQLMLFSATIPPRIRALANRYMNAPAEITISGEHVTLDNIKQVIVDSTEDTKLDQLCEQINAQQPYLAMIFCHTKQRVTKLTYELARRGYLVDELHGDLSQVQRNLVLRRFRSAELQLLVTTDIAARGLDIEGVTAVYNYDIPHDAEMYIHRIGRTGRAGAEGLAVTFVNARQYDLLRKIEQGIQSRIEKKLTERSQKQREKRIKIQKQILKEREEEKAKKAKPLSKYANRKGAEHKGHNGRSRRAKNQGRKAAVKTNQTHRSKRR